MTIGTVLEARTNFLKEHKATGIALSIVRLNVCLSCTVTGIFSVEY